MSRSVHLWKPLSIYLNRNLTSSTAERSKSALVILNQPISKTNETKLVQLWRHSCLRVCTDGATNRLHEWSAGKPRESGPAAVNPEFIPDYICGDLDSIDPEIKSIYEANGSKTERLFDQDATDFLKTLRFVRDLKLSGKAENEKYNGIEDVHSFCEFGGRLDHSLSNLSTLHEISQTDDIRVYLIGSESVAFVLKPGTNVIYLNEPTSEADKSVLGKYCGFFPMAKPAIVTTYGLKWNIKEAELEFGKFISSSNEFSFDASQESPKSELDHLAENGEEDQGKKRVIIKTSEPLLWTMSIEF